MALTKSPKGVGRGGYLQCYTRLCWMPGLALAFMEAVLTFTAEDKLQGEKHGVQGTRHSTGDKIKDTGEDRGQIIGNNGQETTRDRRQNRT